MTLIDFGGFFVDRDRALAELHPPLKKVASERPSAPRQRAFRAAWEAAPRQALVDALTAARSQVADAEAFIAEMRRRDVPDKDGIRPSEVVVNESVERQVAAYAARKRKAA
ncbi:hypothetical protein GCM10010915_12050 [Microbacterium faecale]|uniref:Uncharacterized protein n=1 Tax=Microbacterium faecale TaxID=1804630 RepID=A0A917DEB0_9MICO|nr:hypothetical protein [Microbacterium faecale]GGD33262.1 hypothetical protein GCM10010915_12050 [Microbacterium faecale]